MQSIGIPMDLLYLEGKYADVGGYTKFIGIFKIVSYSFMLIYV